MFIMQASERSQVDCENCFVRSGNYSITNRFDESLSVLESGENVLVTTMMIAVGNCLEYFVAKRQL